MPDIYTHILNGKESLKKISEPERSMIKGMENIFCLGCMGPDMFFYHNFYPWKVPKNVRKLGSKMHREHCGDIIAYGLEGVKEEDSFFIDEKIAYIFGYICHYALDSMAHPFIYSRAGMYKKHQKETFKFITSHKVMELAIDCHMAKYLYNQDINEIKMYEFIDVGEKIPESIEKGYMGVLKQFFEDIINNLSYGFVNESYMYIKKAWELLYDPYFRKRRFLKPTGLSTLFHPINPYDRDYMNESREKWPDPITNDMSNKTFYEIFEDSVEMAVELINTSIRYLKGNISFEFMRSKIGNFSFLTGSDDCFDTEQMQYFRPIF